jgi:hypothetical protein
LQAEKIYLENKVVEVKKKYELSKKDYFQQSKNCKNIKINLEEMIEKQSAFHNTLLILNNEMIDLSVLISKEKEKIKKGLKINIDINENKQIPKNSNLTILNNKDEKKGK